MEWRECTVCSSYLVSDEGDIKHKQTGKIRKQKLNKDNYLEINLSMGSRHNIVHRQVHRLVAEAFIPNPENKPQVNHKDGDKTNNNVSNLEWVTPSENQLHARKLGLKPDDTGTNSPNSNLTANQIQYCRTMYKPRDKTYGCIALAKRFNVSKSTMSYILNNITYK